MAQDFNGSALAMTSDGLSAAATKLGVTPVEIWTVFEVETNGCGFLNTRSPIIRYEKAVFSRLTKRAFDDKIQISAGDTSYGALNAALAFDRKAALQSCSWGLGQVMGENFAMVGFTSVEDMVTAMCGGEDAQLMAMAAFAIANRLDSALRGHLWAVYAKGYNGPNFADNHYDTKLANAFAKYSTGPLPDLNIRAAQMYLGFHGFPGLMVDGVVGPHTIAALTKFQEQNGLHVSGEPDEATLSALAALPITS